MKGENFSQLLHSGVRAKESSLVVLDPRSIQTIRSTTFRLKTPNRATGVDHPRCTASGNLWFFSGSTRVHAVLKKPPGLNGFQVLLDMWKRQVFMLLENSCSCYCFCSAHWQGGQLQLVAYFVEQKCVCVCALDQTSIGSDPSFHSMSTRVRAPQSAGSSPA